MTQPNQTSKQVDLDRIEASMFPVWDGLDISEDDMRARALIAELRECRQAVRISRLVNEAPRLRADVGEP